MASDSFPRDVICVTRKIDTKLEAVQIYSDSQNDLVQVACGRNRLDNGAFLSFSHLLLYIPPFHFLGFELFSQLVGALSHDQCLGMCSLACLGACQLVDGEVSIYWLLN